MKIASKDEVSYAKISQLQGSNTIPPIYISLEGYEFDSGINAIVYDIEIGVEKNQKICSKHIKRRYSALNMADIEIRKKFGGSSYLLKFPQKKILNQKNQDFLENRAKQLRNYLASLVKIPGLLSFDKFISFFELSDLLTTYDDI